MRAAKATPLLPSYVSELFNVYRAFAHAVKTLKTAKSTIRSVDFRCYRPQIGRTPGPTEMFKQTFESFPVPTVTRYILTLSASHTSFNRWFILWKSTSPLSFRTLLKKTMTTLRDKTCKTTPMIGRILSRHGDQLLSMLTFLKGSSL